jgi:hypothetical protein
MSFERSYWAGWVQFLQRWKLVNVASVFLESTAPLNIFFAQMVYMVLPLFRERTGSRSWEALAHMLENTNESRGFADYLREENS